MLSNALNTNEVKDAAGAEVEFEHLMQDGRTRVFHKVGESPSGPYRLTIAHLETNSGIKKRRRSAVRFDKTVISDVDDVTPVTSSAYAVCDSPIGALTATTEMKHVLANLMSFLATTGAATTVLFDCTGSGADVLINGGL